MKDRICKKEETELWNNIKDLSDSERGSEKNLSLSYVSSDSSEFDTGDD